MAALALFLRPLTTSRTIGIWLCFVFALLSKEQGLLLPLLLLAAIPLRRIAIAPVLTSNDALENAGVQDDSHQLRRSPERQGRLTLVLLLLWSLAGYIFFRERILKFWWDRSFLDPMINPMRLALGADRWLMPIDLLGHYAALLIAPIHLSPDYGAGVIGWHVRMSDPYFYLGLMTMVLGLAGCAIAIRRRRWNALFCLISFGLLYGMVSNLPALIGINFAERLMYIPSAFACILAAIGAAPAAAMDGGRRCGRCASLCDAKPDLCVGMERAPAVLSLLRRAFAGIRADANPSCRGICRSRRYSRRDPRNRAGEGNPAVVLQGVDSLGDHRHAGRPMGRRGALSQRGNQLQLTAGGTNLISEIRQQQAAARAATVSATTQATTRRAH